jgi:L-alanine-DL-glutamate epimerase-like enolase superfamily enzyme
VTFHSGAELGISTAACLHLAASIPNLMLAVDHQYDPLTDDLIAAPHLLTKGSLSVPKGSGLGVSLAAQKRQQ